MKFSSSPSTLLLSLLVLYFNILKKKIHLGILVSQTYNNNEKNIKIIILSINTLFIVRKKNCKYENEVQVSSSNFVREREREKKIIDMLFYQAKLINLIIFMLKTSLTTCQIQIKVQNLIYKKTNFKYLSIYRSICTILQYDTIHMIRTLHRLIHEHLQYTLTICNFLHTIQYVLYNTNNYGCVCLFSPYAT